MHVPEGSSPVRAKASGRDCCLPAHAYRRLWVRLPGLILLSTTIPFSELNDAACVLALPLLRTPPLSGRPSVRLPTGWLAFGRVGLDGFRHLTHWVTLMSFKGYHPCSLVPDLSRHEHDRVRCHDHFVSVFVCHIPIHNSPDGGNRRSSKITCEVAVIGRFVRISATTKFTA